MQMFSVSPSKKASRAELWVAFGVSPGFIAIPGQCPAGQTLAGLRPPAWSSQRPSVPWYLAKSALSSMELKLSKNFLPLRDKDMVLATNTVALRTATGKHQLHGPALRFPWKAPPKQLL